MRHLLHLSRIIAFYIAPLVLFGGGVYILILRIPVVSLLAGVPAVLIGISLTIVIFDAAIRHSEGTERYHIVACEVCGDPTAAPLGETHEKCPSCRRKAHQR